jgi:hypothetical protein
MKPRIFIGSSTESLKIAECIQSNLDYDSFPEIWTQNIFQLSKSSIESLFEELSKIDFAIFVLTPDDVVKIQDDLKAVARDNVIFELGLFMGKLGRDRVFFLIPRHANIHLPTDLLGIEPGTYDANHPNLTASLGPFSTKIKEKIYNLFKPTFAESTSIGPNVLHPNARTFKSGINYCFEATSLHNSELMVLAKNLSSMPRENGWQMQLGRNDGWIHETYDSNSQSQVFRLSENKTAKMNIQFRGNGSAKLEYYINEQLDDTKEISWN